MQAAVLGHDAVLTYPFAARLLLVKYCSGSVEGNLTYYAPVITYPLPSISSRAALVASALSMFPYPIKVLFVQVDEHFSKPEALPCLCQSPCAQQKKVSG
eukprot:1159711-Pelagomonas_calceolata.AAC.10